MVLFNGCMDSSIYMSVYLLSSFGHMERLVWDILLGHLTSLIGKYMDDIRGG